MAQDITVGEFNLGFEEFAESAKVTGAVNRFPQLGDAKEMLSYTVYLNGPYANQLPPEQQQFTYSDVLLHARTEKLGLDPSSARDNLKVAELIVVRETWLEMVLDASSRTQDGKIIPMPDKILDDYEKLSAQLTHPWIMKQIEEQRTISQGLKPALDQASQIAGRTINDVTPNEYTKGTVISQTKDYTVQAGVAGDIVTHENRRLNEIPKVGQEVMVSYYRGQGQVIPSKDKLVSPPFIEPKTQDLAVRIADKSGTVQQIMLFNGLASYAKFVEAEKLDKSLIVKAIEAREKSPKTRDKSTTISPEMQPLAARFNNLVNDNPKLAKNPELLNTVIAAVEQKITPEKNQSKTQSTER